jgi:hypothetical protein
VTASISGGYLYYSVNLLERRLHAPETPARENGRIGLSPTHQWRHPNARHNHHSPHSKKIDHFTSFSFYKLLRPLHGGNCRGISKVDLNLFFTLFSF